MANINLGNAQFEIRVNGADEAIDKLNELEKKLKEVKSLISEITSMEVNLDLFNVEKQEDGPSDTQHRFV